MEYNEIKKIESKVKNFLGVDKLPDYNLVINEKIIERTAFNQEAGDKYIITVSPNNLNGLKHELIHLALKKFSYSDLKISLAVPKKYINDNKKIRLMEYLTICLEIKMGSRKKIKKNLDNYKKYGFSKIKNFYKITDNYFNNRVNQKLINKIIKSIN